MNFTVVVRYRGAVEEQALEKALATLQGEHLLLRSTLLWDGESCRFAPTAATVPVQIRPWPGDRDPQGAAQAWKPAAKAALRQRFSGGGEPLWGITWLKSNGGGELLLTFHHAIADGLSSMALVQRLFVLLAARGDTSDPRPSPDWEALTPDLERAFPWQPQDAIAITTLKDRQDGGLTTSYALSELSAPSTQVVQAGLAAGACA